MLLFCHFTRRFPPSFSTCLPIFPTLSNVKLDEGSHISFHGRTVDFPAFPLGLLTKFLFFPLPTSLRCVAEVICWSNEKRWLQFHVCRIEGMKRNIMNVCYIGLPGRIIKISKFRSFFTKIFILLDEEVVNSFEKYFLCNECICYG